MTTQTKDRGANDHDTDGQRAATDRQRATATATGVETAGLRSVTALTEQAGEAALAGTRQAQDSILALVHQGQDGIVMMARMWTESVGRLTPFGAPAGRAGAAVAPAAEVVRGGYDLFDQLLTGQRQFVDRLIAEQRRFAEQLLTPPDQR